MSDFGEPVVPDMHFADGETAASMHEEYPALYQRAVRRAVDTFEWAHPGRQICSYNRAGSTGSTRYEDGNFPRDETTDFSPASGLQAVIPDMLNRGLSGTYGYSTDIGGYEDLLTGRRPRDCSCAGPRWTTCRRTSACTARSSPAHMCPGLATRRPPPPTGRWLSCGNDSNQNSPINRARSTATGTPLARPVWLLDPSDPAAWAADREWTLGSDPLIAPVVTQGATGRAVFLPAGYWQRQDTSGRYAGSRSVTVAAALTDLPYFARCGSAVDITRTATPAAVLATSAAAGELAVRGGSAGLPLVAATLLAAGVALRRRGARRLPPSRFGDAPVSGRKESQDDSHQQADVPEGVGCGGRLARSATRQFLCPLRRSLRRYGEPRRLRLAATYPRLRR